MRKTTSWVGLVMWLLSAAAFASGAAMTVKDPWVRAAPPGAPALAGYMMIHNSSDKDRALTGASSAAFGKVMLHRTVIKNGMASMVHQARIVVPAKGGVTFAPNGYHIMLMQPKQTFKPGDKVTIVLHFADGTSMPVEYEVRKADYMPGMNHMDRHK